MGVVGCGEGVLAGLVDGAGGTEVHRGGGMPRDAGMAMNVVVFEEEAGTECAGVGEAAEPIRKVFGRYLRVLNCASENGLMLL